MHGKSDTESVIIGQCNHQKVRSSENAIIRKCDHGLWLTIANVLASGTVSILPLISGEAAGAQVAAYDPTY
jgi:hypothetical protein